MLVGLAFTPCALALNLGPTSSALSARRVHAHSCTFTALHRVGQTSIMMRDFDEKEGFSRYLSVSTEAWAKTARERPVFFALRVVILSSGIYFFATLAGALAQRAL